MVTGPVPGPRTQAGPGRLVFGIDAVPVSRAQQLLDRYGTAIGDRVATPAEASWIGMAPVRLGAVLGLKEAAIKALAGRPEPFRWQLISTGVDSLLATFAVPAVIPPGGWPPAVVEVVRGFATGMGLSEFSATPLRLAGAGLARARVQLPALSGAPRAGAGAGPAAGPAAGPGIVSGVGCFGLRDDHVLAAACFWREGDDE